MTAEMTHKKSQDTQERTDRQPYADNYLHPSSGLKLPLPTQILCTAAESLGIEWKIIDPKYCFLVSLSYRGKSITLKSSAVTPNSYSSCDLTIDKVYTYMLLSRAGIKIPRGDYFFKSGRFTKVDLAKGKGLNEARKYSRRLATETGYPIVIKPAHLQQGLGVSIVHGPQEISAALKKALSVSDEYMLIVQEFVKGNEYRLMLLDDDMLVCYKKVGFNLIANLSSGARARIETARVHPSYLDWAKTICAVTGLEYVGIDLRCGDIARPVTEAIVLEVNGNPGLTHLYQQGSRENDLVAGIYKKLLRKHFNDVLTDSAAL